MKSRTFEDSFTNPEDLSEWHAIKRRWADFSPNDIQLFKELPDWRQIVTDVYFLLELQKEIKAAYNVGFVDGETSKERLTSDAYDEGYEAGFEEGLEEGARRSIKSSE